MGRAAGADLTTTRPARPTRTRSQGAGSVGGLSGGHGDPVIGGAAPADGLTGPAEAVGSGLAHLVLAATGLVVRPSAVITLVGGSRAGGASAVLPGS